MIHLPLPPKVIKKNKYQAVFEVQELYPGYGVTIGNALRRILLTSLQGVAIVEVKIKGASHEFSTIAGVLEDVIMITLNLKKLRFKIYEGESQTLSLFVKGEKKVTGADFKITPQLELINPEVHIATITDKKTELNIEIKIEKGIGYEPKEQRKVKEKGIGTIVIDAIFTPIKSVSFQVENMRTGERTDFDRLKLEIETDGTISPEEAFYQACKILINHLNVITGERSEKTHSLQIPAKESDISKKSVEDLKLPTRTLNALISNNIKTVGGIMEKSEKEISQMDEMGDKAVLEIKRKLKKLGLKLKE